MGISEQFAALDNNLKLDPGHHARAIEVHNLISVALIAAGVAKATRLQGSFARKTMLPPLKDVDKVVELSDSLFEELSGPGGPRRAMQLIMDALTPILPGALFKVKRHALGIELPDEPFDFDAVPAFHLDSDSDRILIANTETGEWDESNTYEMIAVVSERNKACGGQFIHQVRMVKQVVSVAGLCESLPGLHVETFAFDAITDKRPHPDAVAAALVAGARMVGTTYADPTGFDQISDRLSSGQVSFIQSRLSVLARQAAEALGLGAAGDEAGAERVWRELFGDAFPEADTRGKSFLQGLGMGMSIAEIRRPTPRSRAWKPA